jgi:hypothetical protein
MYKLYKNQSQLDKYSTAKILKCTGKNEQFYRKKYFFPL